MSRCCCLKAFVGLSVFVLFASQAAGQTRQERIELGQKLEREALLRDMERARRDMSKLREPEGRDQQAPPKRHLTEAQKQRLSASAQDHALYASFLHQPETGLIRLLPQAECDESRILHADAPPSETVVPIPGCGSFYSFRVRTHDAGPWSDIRLENGRLFAGFAGYTLGMMTSLGDTALEDVTLASDGVAYLAGFVPPTEYKEAEEQYERNNRGFRVGNFTYASHLRALDKTTYVLRSIAFRQGTPLDEPLKKIDVLIAFRVVSRDPDGSLTLLWKRLQKKNSPKLKREDEH